MSRRDCVTTVKLQHRTCLKFVQRRLHWFGRKAKRPESELRIGRTLILVHAAGELGQAEGLGNHISERPGASLLALSLQLRKPEDGLGKNCERDHTGQSCLIAFIRDVMSPITQPVPGERRHK